MNTRQILFIISVSLCFANTLRADEGLWLPMLLGEQKIEEMQRKGLNLSSEDIYSINTASLKDAVPVFGGGCTAAMVSDKGLLLTNHHCGFSQIQSHSTFENDLVTIGFTATSTALELPNPGLSVTFLIRMEDVTNQVLNGVTETFTLSERQALVDTRIKAIEARDPDRKGYDYQVKSFFSDNAYYLVVTQTYSDVRLVFAPPFGIGKFGGETDNWMWPRHTGDFAVFRVYAGKDNQPAAYSPDNVPYRPVRHLSISMSGVSEGDFTFVMGYPGRTKQYQPGVAIRDLVEHTNPRRIEIRQQIIDVMEQAMASDPAVRLQYASRYVSLCNSWKKWQGESLGLVRTGALARKDTSEAHFRIWLASDSVRMRKYSNLLDDFVRYNEQLSPLQSAYDYYAEALLANDALGLAFDLEKRLQRFLSPDDRDAALEKYFRKIDADFSSIDLQTEQRILAVTLNLFLNRIEPRYDVSYLRSLYDRNGRNATRLAAWLVEKSMFFDAKRLKSFASRYKPAMQKKLENDPLYRIRLEMSEVLRNRVFPQYEKCQMKLDSLNRLYVSLVRTMYPDSVFYPDANFSMRVSYGNVAGYSPRNGVQYLWQTTLEGVIEKDNPSVYDYQVPERLKQLYAEKDYGDYGENGQMPVCFLASNHTSGGNSGSPVLNADGLLIGLNFDRCWEGTMSDVNYDIGLCRNIVLDIRYVLFVLDRFAGARSLVEEMTLVR